LRDTSGSTPVFPAIMGNTLVGGIPLGAFTWCFLEKKMNDLVALAAERAANCFGGNNGMFNAAGFSNALTELANVNGVVDGEIVRVILAGRPDIEVLKGGCHYRLIRGIT